MESAHVHCSIGKLTSISLYLFATVNKELVGVGSIGNCIADEGYPMEDQRRLMSLAWKGLPQYVAENECQKSSAQITTPLEKRMHIE